jgi:hypothetical protein
MQRLVIFGSQGKLTSKVEKLLRVFEKFLKIGYEQNWKRIEIVGLGQIKLVEKPFKTFLGVCR